MDSKKFNIEWHSILRDVFRNIWVIVCAAIIGVLGSYVATHSVYHPEYTSHATLIINSAAGKANAIASLSQSSEIAAIYSEVFVQPSMQKKVCEYLNKEEFDGTINATVNEGTNIMELSVRASNPENAFLELRAILEVYPSITSSLYSNGVVSVLRDAGMPTFPSNSMTSSSAMRIALIAMLIALIPIVLISVLRDTVKNKEDFADKIEANLIGYIPHEKKTLLFREVLKGKKRGILINDSAFLSLKFSENINKISGKLDYMRRTNGDKVFAVTSVTENEGKSTISSNIALSLAIKGYRVVLLDFDGKKPALYKIFEQNPENCMEFGDALSGKIEFKDYTFTRYKKTSLFLALSTKYHKDYQKWFENGTAKSFIRAVSDSADFVIVDTAPMSFDGSVTDVASFCDAVMLVVRTDRVYAPIINDSIMVLKNTGSQFAGCVLNDVYDDFVLLNQFGSDETGYTHNYGGHYSKYSKYGKYGKYGKYDKYSKYSKYSKYNKYRKYNFNEELEDVEINPDDMPKVNFEENDRGGKI